MTIITFNNLSKADGSAVIDQNDTIVQATVFGPVDVAQSKINYEEAIVEIMCKPKEMEDVLKTIFKEVILTRLHPRTSISILVQEIYNGGSLLSASINAVCCALIDAGVPMKFPVAGVTVKLESSRFDFVFDNNLNIITILTEGSLDEQKLKRAIEDAQEVAKRDFNTFREKVRQRFAV